MNKDELAALGLEVPIAWDDLTLSWNAVCGRCRECLFMLPLESRTHPDRPHVQHACFK